MTAEPEDRAAAGVTPGEVPSMFGSTWDKAEATIVAALPKYTGDGSSPSYEFVADVHKPGSPSFRATLKPPTIATDFWRPNVGDVVSVLVKSGGLGSRGTVNGKVKFDQDDPRISLKAYEADREQDFEAARLAPFAQPGQHAAQPGQHATHPGQHAGHPGQHAAADEPDNGDPATRLSRLQNLRDQGLLTDEEYSDQRRRIFDEL